MSSPLFAYYVTAHGYGHATRSAAVAAELERRGARVVFRTGVPAWLFAEEGLAAEVEPALCDVGLVMKDALTVDVPASLHAYMAFLSRWDEGLRAETSALRRLRADAVVTDAGALPIQAARRLGLPVAVVGNFTWDWVLEPYASSDRRWDMVQRRLGAAYSQASVCLHLPLGGDAPAVSSKVAAPLVVRRARLSREETRRRLGLDPGDRRPLVAFSFGGVGWGSDGVRLDDPLEDVAFVGYVPRPAGLRSEWRVLPQRSPVRHCDIVAAADAVFTKPGYGTFSEILGARTPALVVPRTAFRECGPLLESLRRWGRARTIERADFEAGRWGSALRELLAAREPWAELDLGGAAFAAERLLGLAS